MDRIEKEITKEDDRRGYKKKRMTVNASRLTDDHKCIFFPDKINYLPINLHHMCQIVKRGNGNMCMKEKTTR